MKVTLGRPLIAAILQLLIPGLGYVYIGKRKGFGIGLIVLGVSTSIYYYTTPNLPSFVWINELGLSVLLAYDVYTLPENT